MMADFVLPKFNRRYVLLPMLAAITLVCCAFYVSEQRRTDVMQTSYEIRAAQERMRLLAEVNYAAADAESAQRGFLLTHEQQYLQPFAEAKQHLILRLAELTDAYRNNAAETAHLSTVKALLEQKYVEMQATVNALQNAGDDASAMKIVHTDAGLHWMQVVRDEMEGMRNRERQKIYQDIQEWSQIHRMSRYISIGSTIFNVVLLLVAGVYITRDIERRNLVASKLDQQVMERNAELDALSQHLQRVTEREKAHLARELHDELGGLLVAIKMDLAQLGKQIDLSRPEIQDRWQRMHGVLAAGMTLKRRVIEELRPTLLDNMGLIAALRWQAEEACQQAGLTLVANLPDQEPTLDANVSIAIFRVAQEALTNTIKHARAKRVTLTVTVSDQELMLIIEDDGIGTAVVTANKLGSHGILAMKYRIQSIAGSFHIGSATPTGTTVVVRVPLEIANAFASLA